jgi:hypothetical protein
MVTHGPDEWVCENGKCCQSGRMKTLGNGGGNSPAYPPVFGFVPFPPRSGGFGYGDGRKHGTSCHSLLGYEASKHPFFGAGTRTIALRQASRSAACASTPWAAAGEGETLCGAGAGASCGAACAMSWRGIAPDKKSPPSMLAANTTPTPVTAAGLTLAVNWVCRALSSALQLKFPPPRYPSCLGYAIAHAIRLYHDCTPPAPRSRAMGSFPSPRGSPWTGSGRMLP